MEETSVKELQNRLELTTKRLEELEKEYEEFAYVISHDLTAPFRQIDGMAQIILRRNPDKFDEKTLQYFRFITSGAKTGQEILEALLKFSRLNTKTQPFETVDCNELVAKVIEEFATEIQTSEAQIETTQCPAVLGDKNQIQELFYQLIKNALLYRKLDFSPLIKIGAKKNENAWEFCIQDNGIGIPEKLMNRTFTVLRRAVDEEEYPGFGIGLPIAKKIVQRHGGKIWLESEENVGTKVYFTLTAI